MALTKEDIEAAIAQTENQDAIRHSLSNYFEGLDEPVAVAIGTGIGDGDRSMRPENVDKFVNLLRSKGVDAVSFIDPQAASPEKFVVTQSGVLCPFMSPKDSLKAATLIEDAIINDGMQVVGHINPLTRDNILQPADSSIKIVGDGVRIEQGINLAECHPDKELFKEIEQRNGGDYKSFVDKKINEAYANSEAVDFAAMDAENVYQNGIAELYRGGTLGAHPYATVSQWNARKVAHSSPAISICAGFSGKEKTNSTRGGAVYEKTQSDLYYGFIYKFESMGNEQLFYHNVGLETGSQPRTQEEASLEMVNPWNAAYGQIYETPVLPHHNKLKEIYIFVGQKGEEQTKLYSIPLDENGNIIDREWQDFMALHEPTDDKVKGYLKDRQSAQIKEQNSDRQHTYDFELKQGLEPDNQKYLDVISTQDFLRNFIHDNEIKEKDGILYVDAVSDENDVCISHLKLKELPDLSNVRINGQLRLDGCTIPETDATKLPECTQGISLHNVNVKNVSVLSAEKFLSITGATANKDGFIEFPSTTSFSGDEIPQDFDKLKFMELPAGLKLVYDTMDKVPETLSGIDMSRVSIKDQSSIESMPAADFIYKIKGNLGTDPLGGSVSYMYSQGMRHTEIGDGVEINLRNTDIATLPKNMKNLTPGRIILNSETVVTSLENFPTTQKGIRDLNFCGDLNNETMESFLLKTKGTEWVENNTSKAEDGHLIINGDLNFKTDAYGPSDGPQMNITSLPKDADKVEIRGSVEPPEFGDRFNSYVRAQKNKDSDTLHLSRYMDLKMDLSQHQATDIQIEGITQDVVLPQKLKSLCISDSENFQTSMLKDMPQDINLSVSRTKNEIPLDMTGLSVSRLSFDNVSAAEINLPQQCKEISFHETKLNKPITLSSGIEIFRAQSTNFPEGSVLDLSECKNVSLADCLLPENATLDLSKCEQVNLSNIDLSKVNVILPKDGTVNINENVKFALDYKLDLSQNKEGFVHHSVECAEVKLPQKILSYDERYQVPKQTTEITTSAIRASYAKFDIPPHVKIVDTPDKNGKKIPLKTLKTFGLDKEHISALRKERFVGMFHLFSKKSEKTAGKSTDVTRVSAGVKEQPTANMQRDQFAISSANSAPQADDVEITCDRVADMPKEQKFKFFYHLRRGVNLIAAKREGGLSGEKSVFEARSSQQMSEMQKMMMKDRGNEM